MIFTVAIDGPAAAGKGTVGREVAARTGFAHLDTGGLYRAVALAVRDGAEPAAAAASLDLVLLSDPRLRDPETGDMASRVAAIPAVREGLRDLQRAFARREGGAVLDGRDIGTVICPEAEVKLFVTATPEERARRRHAELLGRGIPAAFEEVLAEVAARDARDMGRADSPLRPARDALLLDTTGMGVAEAVERAMAAVAGAMAARGLG